MTLIGNIGKDDRIIRALIGVGFISMVFVGPETAWGWFGLVPLLTAGIGFCPLYTKLGFDTSDKKAEVIEGAVEESVTVEDVIVKKEVLEKEVIVAEAVVADVEVDASTTNSTSSKSAPSTSQAVSG